jgi:hypothetical protein
MDHDSKLDTITLKIRKLEYSEKHKSLFRKSGSSTSLTQEEHSEWALMPEQLDSLEDEKEFYQETIRSQNADAMKKAETIRKKYN